MGLGLPIAPFQMKTCFQSERNANSKVAPNEAAVFETIYQGPRGLLTFSHRLHLTLFNKSVVFNIDLAFRGHVFSQRLLEFGALPQSLLNSFFSGCLWCQG